MDFNSANEKLRPRDSRKLENNTYLQRRSEDSIAVKLHATDVLTFHRDGRTVYQSGGWRTVTTKDRMNAYGPRRICTERGIWYVSNPPDWDKRVVYADGLVVHGDGSITGASELPDERGDKRAIKRFVAGFVAALEAGKVPAPSGGDCWYCAFREVETGRPMGERRSDHVRGHIEESYFVPSLLARAMEVFGASPASRQWLAAYWDVNASEELRASVKVGFYADHGRKTCAKVLRRYISRQLGYAV